MGADLDLRRIRAAAWFKGRGMPASAGLDLDDLTQIGALAALEATPRFVNPDGGATLGGWQSAHAGWAVQREVSRQQWPSTIVMHPLPEDFDAIDEDRPSVEEIVDQRMRIQAVIRAAESLKERDRRLLHQIYAEGMTEAEAARANGSHQPTVSRALARIVRHLRKALGLQPW